MPVSEQTTRVANPLSALLVTTADCSSTWLAETLANDSALHMRLDDARNLTTAVARLRDSVYDVVLIRHLPPALHAADALDAVHTGGSQLQPSIVLGDEPDYDMADVCYEHGADGYVCINSATTRSLVWQIVRAAERFRLQTENRRLRRLEQNLRQHEQQEALETLSQIQAIAHDGSGLQTDPSDLLVSEIRETLRAYIIMGSGSLDADAQQLVELSIQLGCDARCVLTAMTRAVEEMLRGLGRRSARHVMHRAHLLTIELMTRLAEAPGPRSVR